MTTGAHVFANMDWPRIAQVVRLGALVVAFALSAWMFNLWAVGEHTIGCGGG